ncbi:MAG: endonuclease/exonuclease/phosphatase family protein [Pseudomonadota bacterium]
MTRSRHSHRKKGMPLLPKLLALSLGTWAVGVVVTWDYLMVVRIGLYAAPILMIAAAVLAVLALLHRARVTALAMFVIAAGLFTPQAPTLLRAMVPERPIAPSIELLSVISLSNRTLNLDVRSTANVVRAEDVDLFLLQEVADPLALIDAVESLAGPSLHHCHEGTYLVFSKYPLGPPMPDVWSGMMACEAYLPSGPTWVGTVHLPRGVTTMASQTKVMDHLLALFEDMPGPKIIGGDFNATPLSSPVQRMEMRMENAFAQAGKGFGFTFPTPARRIGFAGPFLQIDYIFHSQDFQTVQAMVMETHPPFADHFPIKALLRPVATGQDFDRD